MAFQSIYGGDRFGQRSGSNVPKKFIVANYAAPAVGDLAKPDITAATVPLYNNAILKCLTNDVPAYLIESINSSNGTLTCWLVPRCIQLVFQYSGSPTVNVSQIQVDAATTPTIRIGGFTRTVVKPVASPNGLGLIVAVDEPATGLCVVEFRGGTS